MTAAQIAREFTRLQRMQRDLRIYEQRYGDLCGVVYLLRRQVVEQMGRLAKLMRYGAAAALLVMLCLPVMAQEHRHPAADMPLHEKFYQFWYMPDNPARSCCSKADCYPTEITYRNGQLFAKRREDGHWLPIPANKIERNRDSPDGRNHLCAPPPNASYLPNTVFCFALGAGI